MGDGSKFLIVAPGPSASLIDGHDLSRFVTIGISHACSRQALFDHHLMFDNDATVRSRLAETQVLKPNRVIWQCPGHWDRLHPDLRPKVRFLDPYCEEEITGDTCGLPCVDLSLAIAVRLAPALAKEMGATLQELNIIGADFDLDDSGAYYCTGAQSAKGKDDLEALGKQRQEYEAFFSQISEKPTFKGVALWNLSPKSRLESLSKRSLADALEAAVGGE